MVVQVSYNIPPIPEWKFGGGRQFGGPVAANLPYVVGEAGPELFVPNSNGTIIPNNKLSDAQNITDRLIQERAAAQVSELLTVEQQTFHVLTELTRAILELTVVMRKLADTLEQGFVDLLESLKDLPSSIGSSVGGGYGGGGGYIGGGGGGGGGGGYIDPIPVVIDEPVEVFMPEFEIVPDPITPKPAMPNPVPQPGVPKGPSPLEYYNPDWGWLPLDPNDYDDPSQYPSTTRGGSPGRSNQSVYVTVQGSVQTERDLARSIADTLSGLTKSGFGGL